MSLVFSSAQFEKIRESNETLKKNLLLDILALLNTGMNCPHAQPFSLGRREPAVLFPLHSGEG